ncbi:MAG: autotransporter outer membrane beta-barrel domain-containing protein, partial [Opitutaceae bacterium]|nr:autotransporter outer membrane beta-barrel domain-containing protein [Opitutaceae bacterium]
AADLNRTAQTVGALDNLGALHFNGGALTVQNGGSSAGALDGAGALNLAGGHLHVAGANPALAVTASIAAGAAATLDHASGLGAAGAAVIADGRLVLDIRPSAAPPPPSAPQPPEFQTFGPALGGTGVFVKTGTGAAAIATANPGFTGSARVEAGRLRLGDIAALGAGATAAPVTVSAAAVLEYRGVAGALANTIAGSGTLAVADTGAAGLRIAHDNPVANSVLENAKIFLGATRALGPGTADVRADARSEIWLDLDGARLGRVTLDGAQLGFTQSQSQSGSGVPPLFKNATVTSLSAAAAGAVLVFNADLTDVSGLKQPGAVADHLTVDAAGGSAGVFTVRVNASGGRPGDGEMAVPLITDPAGAAVYQLEGGTLVQGLDELKFASGTVSQDTLTLDPRTWYLYSSGLSQTADAIIDTASLLGKDWHYSLDALHQRMGEVREEAASSRFSDKPRDAAPATGNVWVRRRVYRLDATNPLTGRGLRQYTYGVSAGADKIFGTETGANLLGAFIDMGRTTRDFGRGGDGRTGSVSAGLYATLLKNNGWYADLVLKADRHKHDFDLKAPSGGPVRGRYNSKTFGASLELGRRLARADGWWLEPGVQAAVAGLGGASYRTTPADTAIDVKVDRATAAQYRGLVRFGHHFKDARWTPYGKFGAVKTSTDGGAIHAHDRNLSVCLDGWRMEAGAGADYRIDDLGHLYLDYEYGRAARYGRPWALNLGYRRFW